MTIAGRSWTNWINHIKEREINVLSGELQRFAIGVVIVQEAGIYVGGLPHTWMSNSVCRQLVNSLSDTGVGR